MRFFFAILFVFLLSCNPSSQEKKTAFNTQVATIDSTSQLSNTIILIDQSPSMYIKNFEPNIIANAKIIVAKIINEKQPAQKIAIIRFVRGYKIECSLTSDKEQLLTALSKVDEKEMSGQLGDGTNLNNALLAAMAGLEGQKNKSILVFSDGSFGYDTKKDFLPMLQANNIKLSALVFELRDSALAPIGWNGKANQMDYGKVPAVKITDSVLFNLVKATNGTYHQLFNTQDAASLNTPKTLKKMVNINNAEIDSIAYKKINFKAIYEKNAKENSQILEASSGVD